MQVQRGTISASFSDRTITLATPVPVGKSFVMVTPTGTFGGAPSAELAGVVDGHYTSVMFRRSGGTGAVRCQWQVITDDSFVVQTITSSSIDENATSKNVTISEVDRSKSFVLVNGRASAAKDDGQYRALRAAFTTDTNVIISRGSADSAYIMIYLTVVTIPDAVVQPVSGTINAGTPSTTYTISEVDLDKTVLLFNYSLTATEVVSIVPICRGMITSPTAITFGKREVACTVQVVGFAITHPSFKVLSGTETMLADQATLQVEETSIKPEITFTTHSALETAYYPACPIPSLELDAQGRLNFTRTVISNALVLDWFSVTWSTVFAPEGLHPTGIGVMPDEVNTFSWTKDIDMTASAYELAYREITTPESDWLTTGKVASNQQRHIFPANTFAKGKDYEWQVRHWDATEPDPSDWSVMAAFNTSNPVIQNPVPVPDSSLKVDIIQLGGRVKSPYGRSVHLTIEIASDAEFTSPTTYTLPAVESGEQATIDHAITEGGTWYIRMTATDTEGLQTVLVYSFFAGQFLQFIDAPDVQTQGPQATHITVRVKGTTTEHTAVITPAPPPDKIIERLIEIESGTVTQCQEVAERLLERWGREQRSISGVVDLIVTLKYQQKVRVKHPQAGIDEELILQKKEHDVLGSQTTHITLGDIILSDDELLARILDELVE